MQKGSLKLSKSTLRVLIALIFLAFGALKLVSFKNPVTDYYVCIKARALSHIIS